MFSFLTWMNEPKSKVYNPEFASLPYQICFYSKKQTSLKKLQGLEDREIKRRLWKPETFKHWQCGLSSDNIVINDDLLGSALPWRNAELEFYYFS